MDKDKELTNRTIPGITVRQILMYTGAIVIGVTAYVNAMNSIDNGKKQSQRNYDLLMELQQERKDDRRLDDARLKTIELQIQEIQLRVTLMEKFIEGYNKPTR